MKVSENVPPAEPDREIRDRRRGYFIFWGILAGVLFGGNFLYGMVLFTRSDTDTCLGCHRFTGPARMWEVSDRHSEGLSCSQCHGSRVDQEGRCGAFTAHPDGVNPTCMGCHPRVLDGAPIGKVAEVRLEPESGGGDAGGAAYRWKLEDLMYTWHLRNRVCLCTDCHRNVAHEKGAGEEPRHRPRLAYCGECHYHAVKDDYVKVSPLPAIRVEETAPAGG